MEVISPSEKTGSAEKKVQEYLKAGVLEVWQVYPKEARVRVRTSSGARDLAHTEAMESPALPGFRVPVDSFFA